jgi:hypothetical protein
MQILAKMEIQQQEKGETKMKAERLSRIFLKALRKINHI